MAAMGFRKLQIDRAGEYRAVTVNPLNGRVSYVYLTAEQAKRVKDWAEGNYCSGNIQDVLPDLSESERELLISGFSDEDWEETFPEETEE